MKMALSINVCHALMRYPIDSTALSDACDACKAIKSVLISIIYGPVVVVILQLTLERMRDQLS